MSEPKLPDVILTLLQNIHDDVKRMDERLGRITVQFLTDAGIPLAAYAMEVPIVGDTFVTGTELEAVIQAQAPTKLLSRMQASARAKVSFSAIEQLRAEKTKPVKEHG